MNAHRDKIVKDAEQAAMVLYNKYGFNGFETANDFGDEMRAKLRRNLLDHSDSHICVVFIGDKPNMQSASDGMK